MVGLTELQRREELAREFTEGLADMRSRLTHLENLIARGEEQGLDVSGWREEAEALREMFGGKR